MRRVLRWLADWRNGATLTASLLVALALVSYLDAVRSRTEALDTARQTAAQAVDARQAATRRIDQLGAQLAELQTDLRTAEAERAALLVQLQAVLAQLQALGVAPLVSGSPTAPTTDRTTSGTPSATPSPSTTTRPPADRPPPTTRPSASPSPTPTCTRLPIVGCLEGREPVNRQRKIDSR